MSTFRKPANMSVRRPSRLGRIAAGLLAVAFLLLAPIATAQVTSSGDDDPSISGQLRFAIENSNAGDRIDLEIGAMDGLETISLFDTLEFDNSVEIDNSSTGAAFVDIDAPSSGTFLQIDDNVSVILRDVGLGGNSGNGNDDIDLGGANSSLTIDAERAGQLISVNIVGLGSLTKEGTADLQLSGSNTFSGGITVEDGDLIGRVSSLGTGAIDLSADATGEDSRLVFEFSGSESLGAAGPAIRDMTSGGGEASIVKRGTGTLNISAATIDASLGFEIEDGQLTIGPTNLTNGHAFDIGEDGTLSIQDPGLSTSTSVITGAGTLNTQAGQLTLQGDPSGFTGTLEIALPFFASSSRVALDLATAPAAALSFNVETVAGAIFEINDSAGSTFSGSLSGGGVLFKDGAGTTTLSGTNTQTGGTVVLGGTLVGNTNNLPVAVGLTTGTTLQIAQESDGTLTALLSSTGSATVDKLGGGTLSLSRANPFMGNFNHQAGGLRFLAGSDLSAAGLRVGTGAVGSTASVSGEFDPSGAGDNVIDIGGSLDLESDARLTVGIAAIADRNLQLAATGPVTINQGATLAVIPTTSAGGTYNTGLTWDILTGSSLDVLGTGFEIEQSLFFFTIGGADVGNAYRLSLTPSGNTVAGAAATSNQNVIAPLLDAFRLGTPTTTREMEYQESLTSATVDEIAGIIDSATPDDLAASTQVQIATAHRTWRGLSDRMALDRRGWIGRPTKPTRKRNRNRRSRPSVNAPPPAPVASAPTRKESKRPWTAYIEGAGLMGELGSSDAKEFEYLAVGTMVGADRALTDNTRFGFALAGNYAHYETNEGANEGDGSSVEGTVYGAWVGDPVEVLVGGRYSRATVETERFIQVGAQGNVAEGDLEGDIFGAFIEVSRGFELPGSIEIAPLASLAYTHLKWGAYDEDGVSPLRVRVDEQEVDSALTSLGFRISAERKMEDGSLIRPRMKVLWNHEWADVEREVSGRFETSLAPTPFTVEGAEFIQDFAEISVGWDVGFVGNANLFLDWEGRFGEDLIENSLSLGGRVVW